MNPDSGVTVGTVLAVRFCNESFPIPDKENRPHCHTSIYRIFMFIRLT